MGIFTTTRAKIVDINSNMVPRGPSQIAADINRFKVLRRANGIRSLVGSLITAPALGYAVASDIVIQDGSKLSTYITGGVAVVAGFYTAFKLDNLSKMKSRLKELRSELRRVQRE